MPAALMSVRHKSYHFKYLYVLLCIRFPCNLTLSLFLVCSSCLKTRPQGALYQKGHNSMHYIMHQYQMRSLNIQYSHLQYRSSYMKTTDRSLENLKTMSNRTKSYCLSFIRLLPQNKMESMPEKIQPLIKQFLSLKFMQYIKTVKN